MPISNPEFSVRLTLTTVISYKLNDVVYITCAILLGAGPVARALQLNRCRTDLILQTIQFFA